MTMGIAFVNMDFMVANVISVRKDLPVSNVINAKKISPVTIVMNASQLISITHCVKVCLSNFLFLKSQYNLIKFLISECICDAHGSTSLECGKDNGVCSCKEGFAGIKCHECKPNVAGDKCDICKPSFFGFPSCQKGLSKIVFGKSKL